MSVSPQVWIHTLARHVAPSVPLGSLPPHVSLSLAVDGLVQLLVVLLHGVQVAQVANAQRDGDQSECHHWFILQSETNKTINCCKKRSKGRMWNIDRDLVA